MYWDGQRVAAEATLVRKIWCCPMFFAGGIMLDIVQTLRI